MPANTRNNIIVAVLLLLLATEAYCVTYYRFGGEGGFLNTTFLLIFSGILVSILPFLMKPAEVRPVKPGIRWLNLSLMAAATVALGLFCFFNAKKVFAGNAVDHHAADMIPQIKVCVNRLLHGEKVYRPMPEIWNGMKPTYMPMMWLAWLPAEVFTNDLRWTNVVAFVTAAALMFWLFPYKKSAKTWALLMVIAAFGFYAWFFYQEDEGFIAHIEESVVIFFYLLLGFGLVKKNPWITGIAAGCCLLSRYVLVFWIPAYLIYTFFFDSRRNALIMFGIITAMELFIFVIPFWIAQPKYFSDVIAYYHQNLPNVERENALGLGVFFAKDQMDWLVRAELMGALLPPFVSLGIYYALRERLKEVDRRLFGICSLKLTMVFFYSFVEIPYGYLFFVTATFTVAVCMLAIRMSSGEYKGKNEAYQAIPG